MHMVMHLDTFLEIIMSSWDRNAAQDLPDNLKLVFGEVLDIIENIEHDLDVQEKYRSFYLRKVVSRNFYPYIHVLVLNKKA